MKINKTNLKKLVTEALNKKLEEQGKLAADVSATLRYAEKINNKQEYIQLMPVMLKKMLNPEGAVTQQDLLDVLKQGFGDRLGATVYSLIKKEMGLAKKTEKEQRQGDPKSNSMFDYDMLNKLNKPQ
jgi:hypothetical protein